MCAVPLQLRSEPQIREENNLLLSICRCLGRHAGSLYCCLLCEKNLSFIVLSSSFDCLVEFRLRRCRGRRLAEKPSDCLSGILTVGLILRVSLKATLHRTPTNSITPSQSRYLPSSQDVTQLHEPGFRL
ncbi:uncharacterized protein EURHEDRAFT_27896 [Aspergillus ruber CBS 135680]|uniref:Uncharacterized protein n=1 Tax=Aspergillus ruber (strain CBS 135680) TaxID=1388766 RepID=A0A017STW1_ASPRC|nr:uncharacterized protein EURHEDRAFT_27896 [Aspergillus ruber CBS 135680]EYE99735.1 hypothetical protein EURHEDRAFT_27896 [Aspergillus ruber CBS 135680]